MTSLRWPLVVLACSAGLGATAAAEPATSVEKVVVYPDRALVTRSATLPCGAHVIALFANLPPAADPESFRAVASPGTVDGVRWQEQERDEVFGTAAKQLKTKTDALGVALTQSLRDESRYQNAAKVARGFLALAEWHLKREMGAPKPATATWKTALDTAIESELKAAAALATTRLQTRELRRQLDEARVEQARLASAAPRKHYRAEAVVSCPTGKTAKVELSYLVGGAGWQPSYEARAHEHAGKIELEAFATVTQTTGEDWRHAQLVLSTAVPRQNATPPKLRPLRVNAIEQEPPRKVLVERSEAIRHSAGASGVASSATGSRLTAMAQGLSVQLAVPEPADVTGDGTPARLRFGRNSLPAELRFRATPKLAPFVYLVADVVNTAPYPILPGTVDLYRGGSFVARHRTETVATGARFPLSFGVEQRLRARRVVLEERERETGLLSKGTRRVYAYRYHVANFLGRSTEIELSDHVPVSEMKDVTVGIDGQTTAGYDLDRSDGVLRWSLKLAAGEERALELAFHVDIPSEYR